MGIFTGTPPSFAIGQKTGVAAGLNVLRDFARAFTDPWGAYTPQLTGSVSGTTGWTRTGYFMQAGRRVDVKGTLTAGAAGSGDYSLSLPVAARTTGLTSPYVAGTFALWDASDDYLLTASAGYIASATTLRIALPGEGGGGFQVVGSAFPWTWAAGDKIQFAFSYEAA